ncbi:MAG: hypothetical protein AMXMBFR7_50170 [Planctomycetota bacterium]
MGSSVGASMGQTGLNSGMQRLIAALGCCAGIMAITFVYEWAWSLAYLPMIGAALGSLTRTKQAVLAGFGMGIAAGALFTFIGTQAQRNSDPGTFEIIVGVLGAFWLPFQISILARFTENHPTLDALIIRSTLCTLLALLFLLFGTFLREAFGLWSPMGLGSGAYVYGIAPLFLPASQLK